MATWAKSDERDRLRMLTAVRDDAAGLPPSIDPGKLAERIEHMQARVNEVEAKAVRVADVMTAGDPGWLASLYMLWSFSVHSAPRSMDVFVDKAPDRSIRGFHWGPSERGLDETLNWGVAVMLEAGPPIDTIFSLDLKDEMVTLDQRLHVVMSGTSRPAARAAREPG